MRSHRPRSISREILTSIITSVITTITVTALGYYTFSKQFNADEKFRLNQNLNKLLDITLQYPFLEDSAFVAWWDKNKNSNNDSSLRYQTYCEYVFNFVDDVCDYYNYDRKEIDKFIDMDDLIVLHKSWWKLPEVQNTQSYDKRFKDLVEAVYK
jgi:hypothetical protein